MIDSRSKTTIGLIETGGITWFLGGERLGNGRMGLQVDDGGAETSQTVGKVGGRVSPG